MEQYASTVRRNILWLLFGQVIGRALRSAAIIYGIIVLSKFEFGSFSYALSIATLMTVLADFGINSFLTREVSRDDEVKRDFFSTIFFLKAAILLTLSTLFIAFAEKVISSPDAKMLAAIMTGVFVFDSLRDFGSALARASNRMDIEGFNNILTNIAISGLGAYFIYTYGTGVSFGYAYLIGTGVGLVSIVWALRSDIVHMFSHFKRELVFRIIKSSWPFGLWALMGTIMINTDILIIGLLLSIEDVAAYSAAQKIIQLLYLAPALIATSFFPTLSRLAREETPFRNVLEDALVLIVSIALPMTLGGIALGDQIIAFASQGGYPESAASFTILASTIIMVFPSILIGSAIFAKDKQKSFLVYVFGGVVGNITLDILLIPVMGITGSALATLINQFIINIYAWRVMQRIAPFNISAKIKKILVSSGIMLATVLIFRYMGFGVVWNIVFSAAVYYLLLVFSKEPSLKFLPTILRGR